MGNKTKKEEEYLSLREFLRQCRAPFAKELFEADNISLDKQERPDIVLRKGDCIFGIEHIGIPLLRTKNGNTERIESAHKSDTFNKYRLDDGVDRLSGKEDDAINEIENIINDRVSSLSEFNHKDYINNLITLLDNHKAEEYRQNILSKKTGDRIRICFLLDIAYSDEFSKGLEYRKAGSSKWNFFIRNDYPFTFSFLNALCAKQFVDTFCIIWHPISGYLHKKTKCYVLQNGTDMKKSISSMVWDEFRLPLKYRVPKKVNLKLEKTQN